VIITTFYLAKKHPNHPIQKSNYYLFFIFMSDKIKSNNAIKIVAGIAGIAILIGGFIVIRGMLTGDTYQPTSNLIRPWNQSVGNNKSKIKFVYLYDYMCSACQSNAENMTTIKSEFGTKIDIVYKPFIAAHPGSGHRMAQASLAAAKQGKFLEYSEKLIRQTPTKSSGLTPAELQDLAIQTGIDKEKFLKDYNSKEIEDQVLLDTKDSNSTILPVSKYNDDKTQTKAQATPTLVILKDDKPTDSWWSGVTTVDTFRTRINEFLK
jgi:protein-disulfide isomerase